MSKEAMKLALEALEENHHLIEEHERSEYLAQYDRVIGALTKALAEQPAQRKPLTDEQIVAKALHLSGLGTSPDVIQFARAIEAAHGIKEQP